ncbi:MAG: HD domain-containing protein, partial [Parasporobacterium sp.]|nr:HD domain-containing protein [Parasporobacterium sp.]
LHDVGKIGIPDAILKKQGRLTPEEYKIIKDHTMIGANILSAISNISYLAEGARFHHERWDGRGYPEGLAGEQIPAIGRIIAIADVYDALASRRHYKDTLNEQYIREEILEGSGTQFDPSIVPLFIDLLDSGEIKKIREEAATE